MKLTGSWRTSALGIAAILTAIAGAVRAMFDNDPTTVVSYEQTAAAIAAGWALLFARDNKVTSEEARAKPPPPDAPPIPHVTPIPK